MYLKTINHFIANILYAHQLIELIEQRVGTIHKAKCIDKISMTMKEAGALASNKNI